MRSRSFKAISISNLEKKIKQCKEDGFAPTLAVVFAHISFDMNEVSNVFQKEHIQCIGASSAGEFIDGELEQPGIACMLLEVDKRFFKILFRSINNDLTGVATEIAMAGKTAFSHPAFIILVSGLTNDGEIILKQIQKIAGETTAIYGGFASEQMKFADTFIFGNDQITTNGIAALVLDSEKISVEGLSAGGWKPIGIVRTITKSDNNKVFTIDNEPALDLIARYLKMSIDDFKKGPEIFASLSKKFQLQLQRNDSYAVMRAPIWVDVDERSVSYTGVMPEGCRIQFALLPSFEVIDNVVKEFENVQAANENPDAILIFSCKAREMIFGPLIAEEVERLNELWNKPMSGFLSYGEIGKVKTKSEYHGMMCSLVLLKENRIETTTY